MKDLILKVLREEVNNGKVTCDNCGWSWSLKDGGHDPYICHQCNHNNEPQKLKESFLSFESDEKLNELYNVFKKYLDKKGFSHKNVLAVSEVIGIKPLMNRFVLKYLNERGIPKIFNSENNIILACNNCGYSQLKFYYTITSIDVSNTQFEYDHEIDLYVDVSDEGYGQIEDSDGNIYKGSFNPVTNFETKQDLYDNLFYAAKDAITETLNYYLEKYGIRVNIDAMDFTLVRP